MNFLDIILIFLGISAGIGSFITGSDTLFKLFFGLIIGFLSYLVLSYQVELTTFIQPELWDSYQKYLSEHSLPILSSGIAMIPILGIFFMIQQRLSIFIHEKSPSHILMGILLPFFLVGILANLAEGTILKKSETWRNIFDFLSESLLFQTFQKLPWAIFLLLGFLILYKSIFLIIVAFWKWIWEEVFPELFQSWKHKKWKAISGHEGETTSEEDKAEEHEHHSGHHH